MVQAGGHATITHELWLVRSASAVAVQEQHVPPQAGYQGPPPPMPQAQHAAPLPQYQPPSRPLPQTPPPHMVSNCKSWQAHCFITSSRQCVIGGSVWSTFVREQSEHCREN